MLKKCLSIPLKEDTLRFLKNSTAPFIYCGPLAYDFLHQNMSQALPSLRTVQRIIHAQYRTLHA